MAPPSSARNVSIAGNHRWPAGARRGSVSFLSSCFAVLPHPEKSWFWVICESVLLLAAAEADVAAENTDAVCRNARGA